MSRFYCTAVICIRERKRNGGEKNGTRTTCLHGGGGPQVGEVTCGGLPHLSRKREQIKMRQMG